MKNLIIRMTQWYIACLLTALIAMTGCQTSSPSTQQTDQTDVLTKQEQMELFASMEENMHASWQQTSAKWSEQFWNLNSTWNRTVYTPPDSTGKQYVHSEERMDAKGSGRSQQKDTIYVDINYDAIRQEFLQLSKQVDELQTQMTHMITEKKNQNHVVASSLAIFRRVCDYLYYLSCLY